MRYLIGLMIVLALLGEYAVSQSLVGNVVRLQPTSLPATCNIGDLRTDSNDSYNLKQCGVGNTWASVGGGDAQTLQGRDISAAAPNDEDVLTWNSGTSQWEPQAPSPGFLNPMTTAGDLIVGGVSGSPGRLGIGAANSVLKSNGSAAAWGAILNANIDAAAAIDYSKLNLTGAVLSADLAGSIDATKIADGSVTSTEFQYINTLSSNAQTQFAGKANTTLNNLGTTSLNASLLFDNDAAYSIGSSGQRALKLWTQNLQVANIFNNSNQQAIAVNSFALLAPGGQTMFSWDDHAAGLSANTHKITGVVNPTNAQDAATKNYVDGASTTGNAATATALAANPTDCASDTWATAIATNGNLTCGAITDAGLPAILASKTLTLPSMTNGALWTETAPYVSTPGSGIKHVSVNSTTHDLTMRNDAGVFERYRPEDAVENKLENPGFEKGNTGWTASGGTLAIATSSTGYMDIGGASGTWDSSSASQTLTSTAYTVGNGYAGTNGLYRCKVRTPSGSATHTMGLWDGTTLTDTITIPSSTTAQYVEITKPFGAAASTIAIRFTSLNSNEPLISIDDCYIGRNFNLGTVTQATLFGTLRMAGCVGWSTTSTSLVDPAVTTGCSYTATGSVSAPATQLPGFTVNNLPPGNYQIFATGYHLRQTGGGASRGATTILTDGTTSASEMTQFTGNDIGQKNFPVTNVGNFTYTSAQSAVTFRLKLAAIAAGTAAIDPSANGVEFLVYRYPLAAESAVRAEDYTWRVDANISGGNPSLGNANVTSYTGVENGSLALVNNTSGNSNVLTAQIPCSSTNASSGTTCSAGNESVGVVFNIPKPQDVRACVSFGTSLQTASVTSSGGGATFQIVETPNNAQTVSQEGKGRTGAYVATPAAGSTVVDTPHQVCGTLVFTSAGQKTLRLMYEMLIAGSGLTTAVVLGDALTALGQRDIHWEVTPLGTLNGVPLLVGSVTSSSSGLERIERIRFSNGSNASCASSPCTIDSQSGSWVTSVTRASTGNYTINIAAGIFSAGPTCTCAGFDTVGGGGTSTCSVAPSPTATAINVFGGRPSVGLSDVVMNVQCMGPR